MLKQKKFPTVLFDDGGVFTDLSLDMLSFGRDSAVIPLQASDALYFSRFKPFSAIFTEVKVPNVVAATLALEYWNGTAWDAISGLVDDTKAFSRSGFLQFDKPEDWAETTVNGQAGYFVRIKPSVDLTGTLALQGMNIVFSDDQDLKGVYPSILNYLDTNEPTFILRHENSRDRVVEAIRKIGVKTTTGSGYYEAYDAWDFLHIDEVRLWALYLTLENIFSGLQSKDSDMFTQKASEYRKLAEQARASSFLSLDQSNDGLDDKTAQVANISSRRLVRG